MKTQRSSKLMGLSTRSGVADWEPRAQVTLASTRVEGQSGVRRRTLGAGETLHGGRFRIEQLLGSGGEGVVYSAFDDERQAVVAIKSLHLDGSRSTSALKREFRLLRGLVHPGLVHLHELFVDADFAFFSMAYVPGESFSSGSRDPETVRQKLVQVADVLSFLHRTGRVHRDVKPSNVIVQPNGRVVLVDFGVALDLSADGGAAEATAGTPIYMAPEVRLSGPATPKSDAFSVGVMLFETLTGHHPFLRAPADGEFMGRDARPSRLVEGIPSDLDDLCAELLRYDPAERATLEDVLERLERSRDLPVSFAPGETTKRPRLPAVGRREPLMQLQEAYEQMCAGQGPFVVRVEGPSGMGKSAMIRAFVDRYADEALVLSGRCRQQEFIWHKAFDGVMDDLVGEMSDYDERQVVNLIPQEEAKWLVPLFPQLSQIQTISTLAPDRDETVEPRRRRHQGYSALARMLQRIGAARPLIIWVDDLQWGDLDSARLLYKVFTARERPRCLLLLSYRDEEKGASDCLRELLSGTSCLSDEVRTTEVRVGALSKEDTLRLTSRLLGDDKQAVRFADAIWKASLGTPLLVTELASHLAEQAEGTKVVDLDLDHIVASRLARVSAAARELFELLAVSGGQLPVRVAARLLSPENIEPLSIELGQMRLARPDDAGLRLETAHEAIREAGLRLMMDRVPRLHRRVALVLEELGADAAQVARHYAGSDQPERTVSWALRAAEEALDALAFEQAAELYRLALSRLPQGADSWEVEARLAQALADAGHGRESAPLFLNLAARAPGSEGLKLRCRSAAQWLISGEVARGQEVLSEVFTEVGLKWPKTPSAAIRHLLRHRLFLKLGGDAPVSPRSAPPEQLDVLRFEACRAAWSVGYISTIHGAANSAQYLRLARATGDREQLAMGYGMEALYRATSGLEERDMVQRHFARAKELMPGAPSVPQQAFLKYIESQSLYLLGDFQRAVVAYEQGDSLFLQGCRGVAWEMNSSRIFWSSALYYLGRHLELDRRMETWLSDARERDDLYCASALQIMRARRMGMPDGQWDEAHELVREAMANWNSPYYGVHNTFEAFFLAHAALCQGQPDVTAALMDRLYIQLKRALMLRVQIVRLFYLQYQAFASLALAHLQSGSLQRSQIRRARGFAERLRDEGVPAGIAWASYVEGLCDALVGDTAASLGQLERASELLDREGFVLHAAAVRYRLGQLLKGDLGARLVRRFEETLTRQGIRDGAGALRALAPGPEVTV